MVQPAGNKAFDPTDNFNLGAGTRELLPCIGLYFASATGHILVSSTNALPVTLAGALGTSGNYDSTTLDETQSTLLTRSALSGRDTGLTATSQNIPIGSESIPFTTPTVSYILTGDARESAFTSSRKGRRFYIAHQTVGTTVTGQTAFAATTPTFMYRDGGTANTILRSITLNQAGTVAGGNITIALMIDTVDRFSAGGTAVVPQNPNSGSSAASVISAFLFNPTASAATGTQRVLLQLLAANAVGTTTQINFKDGLILGTSTSLLLYTFAAVTGPSWFFTFEHEEAV